MFGGKAKSTTYAILFEKTRLELCLVFGQFDDSSLRQRVGSGLLLEVTREAILGLIERILHFCQIITFYRVIKKSDLK